MQTHAYVAERLRIAGASWTVFTPEALECVHRYSRGIPRLINLVCEHSLIVAFVEQVKQVTPAMVEGVALELELESQPFLLSTAAMSGGRDSQMRAAAGEPASVMSTFTRDLNGRQDR